MLRSMFAIVVAGVLAAPMVSATQQSPVDELLAKNLAAKGGAKVRDLQSMKQVSSMSMQGMDATMTVYTKRPNRLRQEISVGGQTVTSGFDGVTPWIINPMAGSNRPIAVTGPQADMLREQGDFDGPLVDYKAKGYTVELLGLETIGDRKLNHVRMVSTTRQVVHLYFDAVTNLEAKRVTEIETSRLEQELSDYRSVDGVMVPFQIRLLVNGVPQSEMKVKTVELNVVMDEAIFRMPRG
jgi:outer membrane lipoprotein-sorting protein